jgi:redox-sensitive bicupin YhaK (pirin superfamily)
MLLAMPKADHAFTHTLDPNRGYFMQVACGQVVTLGQTLQEGDGLEIQAHDRLEIQTVTDAQLLLFDLRIQKNQG